MLRASWLSNAAKAALQNNTAHQLQTNNHRVSFKSIGWLLLFVLFDINFYVTETHLLS
jgi:hypothetical protein